MAKAPSAEDLARDDEHNARMRALEPGLIVCLEALAQLATDVRKGRKGLAVLIMFDQANPDNIVGYRLGVVDLTHPDASAAD